MGRLTGSTDKRSAPGDSRERILRAAAAVFTEHGVADATTRRIAEEAGVNEVTIFRIFGSKAALLQEAVRANVDVGPAAVLPRTPADPERELTARCSAQTTWLRESRALFRKCLLEGDANPELSCNVQEGMACAAAELHRRCSRRRTRSRWRGTSGCTSRRSASNPDRGQRRLPDEISCCRAAGRASRSVAPRARGAPRG